MGGIDVGRIQQRVLHESDTAVLSWQAVDAAEQRQHSTSLLKGLAGAHRCAVVHAEHQINLLSFVLAEPLLDRVVGRGLGPVALQGCYHLDARVLGNGLPKAVVALDGGRRTLQTHHLDDFAMFI